MTFAISVVVGVLLGIAIGLLIVGERSTRSPFDLPLPAASVRKLRSKHSAARADLRRVLKVSRVTWFSLALALLVVAGCTDPNLETCETARSQSFVLQPPFACRIEQWPDGASVYPVNASGGEFLQLLDAGAAYAGPAQYDTVLKEPGVLAALPDGNCDWLPCHGGVPPVDAGAALPSSASCPPGFYLDGVHPSGEYTCRSKPPADDPIAERRGIIAQDAATELHGRIACAAGELAYASDFRHVGCGGGQS